MKNLSFYNLISSFKFIFIAAIFLRVAIIAFNYFSDSNSFIGPDSYGLFHAAIMLSREDISFLIKNKYYLENFYLFIMPLFLKIIPIKSYSALSLIGIILWILSFIIILKIFNNFKVEKKHQIILLSFFSFWPSNVIFTATVSREAFQFFMLNLIIYLLLNLSKKLKISDLLFLLFALVIITFFHKAFFFTSLIVLSIIFFFYFFNQKKIEINFKFIIFISTFIFIIFSIFNYTKFGYQQFIYGLPKAVETYQNGLLISSESRANFREYPVNIANYYELIFYGFTFIKDYFLRPNISEVIKISDLLSFFENIIRIFIISIITINILRYFKKNKSSFMIFLIYLFIEFVWALGTSNWGTAMRHHSVANGILIIALGLTLSRKINE
jgi:hypothetical protein